MHSSCRNAIVYTAAIQTKKPPLESSFGQMSMAVVVDKSERH